MEELEKEMKATQGSLKPPGKRTVQAYALWLKIHDGVKNVHIRMRNWLGAWWGLKPVPLVHTEVPINLYHIIDIMLRVRQARSHQQRFVCSRIFASQVHAHEIFVDGCFNGDPHPGSPSCANPYIPP